MKELLDFACSLADAAAEVILPHFRSQLAVDNKAGPAAFDPVTIADRDAETAMRALIERHHPSHGILGEEHGTKPGSSDLLWVLDPIDGTRGFMTGLPTWGTLIGLQTGDTPVVGVMNQPFIGERFVGSPDGAELRGRAGVTRLSTRRCARIEEAVLACTTPEMFQPDELVRFDELRRRVRLTRFGGDCYGFALLAAGLIDLVVEASLKPYDIVALMPIIERAGGVVTTWDGGPAHQGGRIVAAGDRALHEAVLKQLTM